MIDGSRVKRAVDLGLSGLGLVAAAPIIAALSLALRRSTGRTGLLRQVRAGLHGQPFLILKLRTMTDELGSDGKLLPDALRVTPLGRLVRSLSLDELPQLINVLRGEMSLVGPRPLPVPYSALYTDRERLRLRVRPGITGWAQVNGRHNITFTERLELDAWYVENWSLRLDAKIVLKTVAQWFRRSSVATAQDLRMVDDRGFAQLWDPSTDLPP